MKRLLAACLLVAGPAVAGAAPQPAEILVSRQLVEARGLVTGDVVRLSATPDGTAAREFRIAGVYEPMPDPYRLTAHHFEARLHLPDLLELTGDPRDPQAPETVSQLNLAFREPADAPAAAQALLARVPMLHLQNLHEDDDNMFVVLDRFHLAIAVVTLIGSSAFLLSLMVMRANERRETAGILRLIGFSRPRILLEVFVEGVCIALSGAVFGVLLALATQGLFNAFFQWHYDTPLVFIRVTPQIALRCLAVALPLGVLAGILASWTLLRRDILSLLRR